MSFLRLYLASGAGVTGLAITLMVGAIAVFADVPFPGNPWDMVARPLIWPLQAAAYPLGTDQLGRDIAAGLAHGARVSLIVGLVATAVSVGIGTLVGALSGWCGPLIADPLGRLTDMFQTMPFFIFALVIVLVMDPSIWSTIIAIGVVTWPPVARLVRGEFLSLRNREFVQACQGMGMSDTRIILTQLLPNCSASLIVTSSVKVATAILTESALAFLGLGDPNVISWGSMIGGGRSMLRTAWYLTALPGVAILITVIGLNLIGDGLNQALNPRLRPR